jgi:FAD dependent oxidoreductase
MRRRDFLKTFGLTMGYSLAVLAGPGASAADVTPEDRRRYFDRIVPPPEGRQTLPAEPHMTLVDLDCDVLVAGGGVAGVLAAVAAARNGARVLLVQDRSRLGGNSSSEVKMHVVGANCHKGRPGWREGGLLEEFRLDDAVNNPQRCFELWDLLLYDKVVSEPNVTLLLDTAVYAATAKDSRITQVMARCDKTEHLYRITPKLCCDCTGDSRLALEAGASLRSGRESRAEFNESLAPEKADDHTLGSSILFTSRQYDRPMPFKPPRWARKVTKEQLRLRKIMSWEYGYWWIEWGGHLSPVRDNEQVRFELLSIVLGVWDYIKNSGNHPDSANWAMDWLGMIPGKRGSRRLAGDHVLTQHDLADPDKDFGDAVAIGGWPMDDHPPGGFDRADLPPARQIHTPEVYSIPLRALYSKNVENLLMAGRNISASHVAFTSTRVMATCGVIGQAVGTAAALCVRHGLTPRGLYQDKTRLKELQQTLLRDDQTIKNVANEDPADLARKARVTASDAFEHAEPANVINGVTRDVPLKAINRWTTTMTPEGPWLELAWEKPQKVREVQLTFDSGFQRELTLSASDWANQGIIRAAQPETVRDYTLLYRKEKDGPLVELLKVDGNHQRLNRHRFEPVEAQVIRLQVRATNGDKLVRVFEVRCYG